MTEVEFIQDTAFLGGKGHLVWNSRLDGGAIRDGQRLVIHPATGLDVQVDRPGDVLENPMRGIYAGDGVGIDQAESDCPYKCGSDDDHTCQDGDGACPAVGK